jgi:hypothetical protein
MQPKGSTEFNSSHEDQMAGESTAALSSRQLALGGLGVIVCGIAAVISILWWTHEPTRDERIARYPAEVVLAVKVLERDGIFVDASPIGLLVFDGQYLHSAVTNEQLRAIAALPDVYSIGLDSVSITDEGIRHLATAKSLQYLWLQHSQVTDAGLHHLSGLTQLTDLGLSASEVKGDGLRYLSNLPKLRNLDLSESALAGGLQHFKNAATINLILDDTQIDDAALEAISTNLPGLLTLSVSGT